MTKFREWYVRHQDAITWFIIGLLTLATIDYVAKENWLWAVISAVLIVINYKFRKFRMK